MRAKTKSMEAKSAEAEPWFMPGDVMIDVTEMCARFPMLGRGIFIRALEGGQIAGNNFGGSRGWVSTERSVLAFINRRAS